MNNRNIAYWVIPPECDAEFVASMEDVLETYEKPYDPAHPVICMDEQPVQLIKDVRAPVDETLQHARRVDYEYERAGVANIFSSLSHWLVGVKRSHAKPKRKPTGLCWLPNYSKVATPTAKMRRWFATISTRTREVRSTKFLNPRERERWSNGSTGATHQSTAVG
jgi:hypothetical protein